MYDRNFYDTIRLGIQQSAAALVPRLIDDLCIAPCRVIDVGSGEGHWAAEFAKHDCDVTAIDGDWHGDHPLGDRFIPHDLNTPLPKHLRGQFDVAVCLEVAEHLLPRRGPSFIAELCGLAPIVIFSAAIPKQGGTGHLNEQYQDYWTHLFNVQGRAVDGEFRYRIWDDDRIELWYRQNLLVAVDGPPDRLPPVLRLVHPRLWEAYR